MIKIKSIFKKDQKEKVVKKYNNLELKNPYIDLPEGVHIIDEEGYIEREKKRLDESTKDFLNFLFVTYGSALIINGGLIYIAVPLKCSERTSGRPSYRVGVFVSYLTGRGRLAEWLKKAEIKIKEEVNETTNGFIEFSGSAMHVFNFPNITANKSDAGYTLMNVVFGNKGIETGIGGLLATDILMREKYSFAFYICDKDEKIEKWNFDAIILKEAKEKEEKYSKIYDWMIKNLRFYAQGYLESVIGIALKKMDFYPPEYIEFLWNKGEVEVVGELLSKEKISKKELGHLGTEQKFELMEQGIEFPLEVESIRDIILRKGGPSIPPSAMREPSIRDIVLEEEIRMLEKIPPSKISLTLRDYGYEIKNSKEARVLLNDYLGRKLYNKSIEELDEEGGVELLAKLLKGGLLDEKICGSVVNKIGSKNDLKILCKKEVIWNKWEGKIRKRWKEIPQEVEEEIYKL